MEFFQNTAQKTVYLITNGRDDIENIPPQKTFSYYYRTIIIWLLI